MNKNRMGIWGLVIVVILVCAGTYGALNYEWGQAQSLINKTQDKANQVQQQLNNQAQTTNQRICELDKAFGTCGK